MRKLDDLKGTHILVTGPTGTVGRTVVETLAKYATVYAMSRFGKAEDRDWATSVGAKIVVADLADPASLSAIPDGLDYVVHLGVSRTDQWVPDFPVNAEGVGHLMARCRNVKAFLNFSTTGVYQHAAQVAYKEDDALGDNHRTQLETYSLSKIAGEQVCRFAARHFGIPTTTARLNVPYGDTGGFPTWHLALLRAGEPIPVHATQPNIFNPIHVSDIAGKIPGLLGCATTDVTVVNLGGSDIVSVEEWTGYIAELLGVEAKFAVAPKAFASVAIDVTRMHDLIGPTTVDWRSGMKSMVEATRTKEMSTTFRS